MTFDDGPSAEYTPRLLDLLKARHLKATFFLIGQNVQAHPELVRRIIAEGHEVGNHTWDHPQLSKLSDERATDEIEKTQDAIRTACGVTSVLLRPPYGALNKPEHVWIPQRLKLNVIYWSMDTLEQRRSPNGCSLGRALVPSSCNTTFTDRRSMPWLLRSMGSSQRAIT
jgi:peptidoglycan/xylan/chitin deacetylase (PgdA/CDA1 family)